MGFGFKDSGGSGYKDTAVGYNESRQGTRPAAGYGAGVGFKDSNDLSKPSGFGFKGTERLEGGNEAKKKEAPDATEMRRAAEAALRDERIAEEKRQAQESFENRQREQARWEQKQAEQRAFSDRARGEEHKFLEQQKEQKT
jgi:hypothetical protein